MFAATKKHSSIALTFIYMRPKGAPKS